MNPYPSRKSYDEDTLHQQQRNIMLQVTLLEELCYHQHKLTQYKHFHQLKHKPHLLV